MWTSVMKWWMLCVVFADSDMSVMNPLCVWYISGLRSTCIYLEYFVCLMFQDWDTSVMNPLSHLCVWSFQIQICICRESFVCLVFQDFYIYIYVCNELFVCLVFPDSDLHLSWTCMFGISGFRCIHHEPFLCLLFQDSDLHLSRILCVFGVWGFRHSAMNSVHVVSGFRHVSITAPTGTPAGRGVPHAGQLRTFVRETCGLCGTGHSAVSIHWDWRRVGTAVDLWWRLQWPGFFCLRNWCESWCCIFLCCKLINTMLNVHRNHKAYSGLEEGGWKGYGGGGWGRGYTYRYTITTRMTPALRWAVMGDHFNISLIVRDKVAKRAKTFDWELIIIFCWPAWWSAWKMRWHDLPIRMLVLQFLVLWGWRSPI